MSLFGQPGNPRRKISEGDVKLCALCGALNYHRNCECFTCGWRGVFEKDAATVHLAWERLANEFNGVEIEHITGAKSNLHRAMGPAAEASTPHWITKIRTWWENLGMKRTNQGSNAMHVRSQAGPPNELGV